MFPANKQWSYGICFYCHNTWADTSTWHYEIGVLKATFPSEMTVTVRALYHENKKKKKEEKVVKLNP